MKFKKISLKIVIIGLLICLAVALCIFGFLKLNSEKQPEQSENRQTITLNITKKELSVGETFTLVASGAEGEVEFYSEKNTIANVDNTGLVTAYSSGVTAIIVACGTENLRCEVTVSPSMETYIKTDISSATLYASLSRRLYACVVSEGKEVQEQPTFYYESSAPSIVSVSAEGILLGISSGDAQITVKATYEGKELMAIKNVTVVNLCVLIAPDVIEISLRAKDKSVALSAQVNLDGEILTNPEGMTWSVADESVAVYDAEKNTLTAVGRGETVATVYFNGKEKTVNIKVDNFPLKNEINSFADEDKVFEGVKATSPGFSGASASLDYYTQGSIGGRSPYGEGFAKASHLVPPSSRVDIYIRGERLQVTVKCLNDLRALKKEGYTNIIVPVYFTFDEKTAQEYLPLWNRGYTVTEKLYPNTWTYYNYPIDEAIKDVTENNELYFYIFNYSGDYVDMMNVDISVYFDSIFAVKGTREISVRYQNEKKSYNAVFEKGAIFDASKFEVEGIPNNVDYSMVFVQKNGNPQLLTGTEKIKLDEVGMYNILIESDPSDDYSCKKVFPIIVVDGEVKENEINSFSNETRVNDNVWTSVAGFVGYSTASFSYHTDAVGGRMPTSGGFVKATHNVPSLEYTEAWARGERLEVRIRCLNDLSALRAKGYKTIVIPVYLDFEDDTKQTFLPIMTNGVWERKVSLLANKWINLEYDIDQAILDVTDGVLTLHLANWSADYTEKINVSVSLYVDAIYVK